MGSSNIYTLAYPCDMKKHVIMNCNGSNGKSTESVKQPFDSYKVSVDMIPAAEIKCSSVTLVTHLCRGYYIILNVAGGVGNGVFLRNVQLSHELIWKALCSSYELKQHNLLFSFITSKGDRH